MKISIFGSMLCLFFLCHSASGRSSSRSGSSSSSGSSGQGQGQSKLNDIYDRLEAAEKKMDKLCYLMDKYTARPGVCPRNVLFPVDCDKDQKSSCYFDAECGETEKCCPDACGVKKCTKIGCKVHDGIVPLNTGFFDGCNHCSCSENGLLACTRKLCHCPNGESQVQCSGSPCSMEVNKCDKYPRQPGITCRDDYCGGCNAEYLGPGGITLDCGCGDGGQTVCKEDPCKVARATPPCPVIRCLMPTCPELICISNYCTCSPEWYWDDNRGSRYDGNKDCIYRSP